MRLQAIQQQWRHKVLAADRLPATNRKQYVLAQFPYPSGSLHMGHARVYTMADTLARTARLRGHPVLCPMGWDAFGLPAENAARDRRVEPAQWTADNIVEMRRQMDNLGFAFEHGDHQMTRMTTCSPVYYKWTQWLFEQLYNAGLAYKQRAPVHWDPVDQTVLADEQVDSQGRSWRSGATVETRWLSQWFIRITAYADRLVDDLDTLEEWPESVKRMQREWIGRQFGVYDRVFGGGVDCKVFLTRPHVYISSMSVPAGHPLASCDMVRFDLAGNVTVPVIISDCTEPTINYHESDTNNQDFQSLGYKVEKRYRLRDWLISRQRKWGCPIPVHTCPEHGVRLTSDPTCNNCKSTIQEPDTMDTFVDSSWYFLRFCDPQNDQMIFDPETVKKWMPVDVYIGGIEHAVLHLLYARFMHKFIIDTLKLTDTVSGEPFKRLICQGLVMGRTFKCPDTHRYLKPGDYTPTPTSGTTVALLPDGRPAAIAFEKMSKSKYNGVDPDQLVELYGADAIRLNILFKAPPEFSLYWDERDLVGQHRWLLRLLSLYETYTLLDKNQDGLVTPADQQLLTIMNDTIDQVTRQLAPDCAQFNTAIAALMKFSNRLHDFQERHRSATFQTCLSNLAIMLYPMAPHTASHLYHLLHPGVDVNVAKWPERVALPEGCRRTATVAVQVDGKTIMKVQCAVGSGQEEVESLVGGDGRIPSLPKRVVFIPDRVINYCT